MGVPRSSGHASPPCVLGRGPLTVLAGLTNGFSVGRCPVSTAWTGSGGQPGNLRVSGRSWQGTQILHLNTISTHSNAWPGNTVSLPTPPSRGHQTGPLTLRDGPQVLESDASQGEAQDLGFRCFIRSGLHKPNSRATCRDLPTRGEQRALRRRSPRGVHLLT